MKIWVDADACPAVVKEILFRAAERTGVVLTLVANQFLRIPDLDNIDFLKVDSGFDVADSEIVRRLKNRRSGCKPPIFLWPQNVIEKGATALNPRGELYSADTYPFASEYAGLYGNPAFRRCSNRRPGRFKSAGQKTVCRATG